MNILVFLEQRGGELKRASLEALGEARRIADGSGGQALGVLFGSNVFVVPLKNIWFQM